MRKDLHTQCESVRAAVRVEDGRFVAAPFCEHDHQTETLMDFGLADTELEQLFRDVSSVFGTPVAG